MKRFLLSVALLTASAAGLVPPASAGEMSYLGHSEYGYAGYSPGGSLYINALPSNAEVSLDGVLVGLANDLEATPVEARPGVHRLTFQAPGYEPTSVLVRVVRDWTTRVRLTLIPAH